MFDERSLNCFLAVKDQLGAVSHAFEQASHGRTRLKEGEADEEQGLAKAAISEYIDEITRLTDLVKTAEDAHVPVGQTQALIATTLTPECQQDIYELAT